MINTSKYLFAEWLFEHGYRAKDENTIRDHFAIDDEAELADIIQDLNELEGLGTYTVFYCGGSKDGQEIAKFADVYEAIKFADNYYDTHDEFADDDLAVCIVDGAGFPVEW